MDVRIRLQPKDRNCLKGHVTEGTSAYTALDEAAKLKGIMNAPPVEYIIVCDKRDAEELLQIARQYCFDAANKIEAGIRDSLAQQT
jgi:hypothetical protein